MGRPVELLEELFIHAARARDGGASELRPCGAGTAGAETYVRATTSGSAAGLNLFVQ